MKSRWLYGLSMWLEWRRQGMHIEFWWDNLFENLNFRIKKQIGR
jgi:hypothetical protein